MNSSRSSLPSDEPPRPRKAPFGGWADYELWAQHDFADRSRFEKAEDPVAGEEAGDQGDNKRRRARRIRLPSSGPGHSHDMHGWRKACRIFPAGVVSHMDEAPAPDDVRQPDWALVRPYVRSGGRASASRQLEVETMVSSTARTTEDPTDDAITDEHRRIRRLCRVPQSVAEVAAQINAPLGVAQVLISDACELGLIKVHGTPTQGPNGRPSLDVLSRVHAGLLRLA